MGKKWMEENKTFFIHSNIDAWSTPDLQSIHNTMYNVTPFACFSYWQCTIANSKYGKCWLKYCYAIYILVSVTVTCPLKYLGAYSRVYLYSIGWYTIHWDYLYWKLYVYGLFYDSNYAFIVNISLVTRVVHTNSNNTCVILKISRFSCYHNKCFSNILSVSLYPSLVCIV